MVENLKMLSDQKCWLETSTLKSDYMDLEFHLRSKMCSFEVHHVDIAQKLRNWEGRS